MAVIYRNRPTRVIYYNRYPNYFTTPVVNNSCQLQVEAMEDNLVAKIQAASTSVFSASATLNSLKDDANAIANQKSACNNFSGQTVLTSPIVTGYRY